MEISSISTSILNVHQCALDDVCVRLDVATGLPNLYRCGTQIVHAPESAESSASSSAPNTSSILVFFTVSGSPLSLTPLLLAAADRGNDLRYYRQGCFCEWSLIFECICFSDFKNVQKDRLQETWVSNMRRSATTASASKMIRLSLDQKMGERIADKLSQFATSVRVGCQTKTNICDCYVRKKRHSRERA